MVDDILLQEIQSLREKLQIALKIIKYYEPNIDESQFIHDLGTCDDEEYITEVYGKNGEKNGSTEA